MKKLRYIAALFLLGAMAACNTLDIPPINVVQDKDVFNDAGMQAYMAALYSRMPIEDFKYNTANNDGFNNWNNINSTWINTGENANRNNGSFANPANGYWKNGYQVIRNCNYLIEQLPSYASTLTQAKADKWIAETKFVRAFTYFALTKRYGGVPITEQVQSFTGENLVELQIPRSSEQEVYDFILSDIDYVIANMPEASEQKGRVNKNVAAAFKSRVALFAGSIARYGIPYIVDGKMLCGIPAAKANDYFKLAFQAAKSIDGKYSLYSKTWSATDKIASATNYANLFLDESSPENILVKGYSYPEAVHSFDAVNSPPRMTTTYGDRYNPTLDYVELFDGLPKNNNGQLKTTNDLGNYIVYDYVEQLFENCEPRLRGTVLLPGMTFKGVRVDLRRGTIVESINPSTPIKKFVAEDMTTGYTSVAFYSANVKQSSGWNNQTAYKLSNGLSINPCGLEGPTSSNGGTTGTLTGFHGRKWLRPDLAPSSTTLHTSTQSWIELRYAEVLLNRAEAALELFQNGVANVDGTNLQEDAYTCINAIRTRAGANLLTGASELAANASIAKNKGVGGYVLAPTRGLQIIRIERRKELAFENKIYWDMLRWRTADLEVNSRIWRKCNPFLFAKGAVPEATDYVLGKYIFDCRYDERGSKFTIATKNYYEPIPGAELTANPLLKQNEQY
ncbi:MAG: RagB/SusD family nutrient uptake outer membrane protein [Mariniphaga sp.]|nr:RagB/SusD family nutrient uptake outer membrane protein [Mariniphaga sp.]